MDGCRDIRQEAAEALGAVPPGPLGPQLFEAVAKCSVSVNFEAVALRGTRTWWQTIVWFISFGLVDLSNPEVFMIRRDSADHCHPGELHCPGTVIRPGEVNESQDYVAVVKRLAIKENIPIASCRKIGEYWTNEDRGNCVSFVFAVELLFDPAALGHGAWYPVDDLPKDVVPSHAKHIIPMAVEAQQPF